ncbi:MAG: flavodoxin-dependent (E)-4-hydroxy-3-methylbut-2-enyl-diphosphate synthase [Candidatus Tectomicrobia bacterium]|uniref:4-hydroxy-3-methylbut-2-en-1-yl diphosphate synthase (flavodoxin) n=1 Tax=Tectimicrobiota bacterium TaxID=2528274 RepID=A0A933GJL3_UNCTE|nr:flavodoxin-dependent (E)-4-hydroxy-3-methylbut-2-enyl-diphosphate synthase [Candidatus Tectomicrobia bacterium]
MVQGRRRSRVIQLGSMQIGGENPIAVQSMTKTDTRDTAGTVAQIKALEEAGCEIIRVAVPDFEAAENLSKIKKSIKIPLVADIHFNYQLALKALELGVDGLRINPGNIGPRGKIKLIVQEAKARGVSIRIGVNGGSLERDLLEKYRSPSPDALVESALRHVSLLEDLDFHQIKISLKASGVRETIESYEKMANLVDYPLHLGLTEAGPPLPGAVKSSLALGKLLDDGIGDTIRVSLTGDPILEVKVAWEILGALNIRKRGMDIISCPTCGRCQTDLFSLVERVENSLASLKKPIKVAIMGCVVNGPGEAREADIGLAVGKGEGLIFRHGTVIRKIRENEFYEALMEEITKE